MEDQSGKRLSNIGSPLFDWAFVASSWDASQCSVSLPALRYTNLFLRRFGPKVVYESLWDMGARQYCRGANGNSAAWAVRYKISAAPIATGLCHCDRCRPQSGSLLDHHHHQTLANRERMRRVPPSLWRGAALNPKQCRAVSNNLTLATRHLDGKSDLTSAESQLLIANPDGGCRLLSPL
jgi:hypothetical protein